MFEALLISIYFSYKNALIAKAKGLNTSAWVMRSVFAFIVALFIGSTIVAAFFYRGPVDQTAINDFMLSRPIHAIFIAYTAVGGCLFVRYRLETKQSKLPEKVEEEDSDQADK